MSTQSNAMSGLPFDAQQSAPSDPSAMNPTRPLYWSVVRELWENRSIYMGPLIVAGVILLGFWLNVFHLPAKIRAAMAIDPDQVGEIIAMPYSFSGVFVMFAAFLVAIFYCLDALHGERRDRSILFWKSLPVSDLTAVLAKALIPLAVLPAVTFITVVALQIIMRVLSSIVLAMHGIGASVVWNQAPFFQMTAVLLYALVTISLWYAPIYAWLLLVSAWARRNTFLWAIFPPLALCFVEYIAFHSTHFAHALGDRFNSIGPAFDLGLPSSEGSPIVPLSALAPGKFLSTPGLWVGLLVAAAFLAGAIQLRRYRQPI
jgi:ABC-2 type transport system permease protein